MNANTTKPKSPSKPSIKSKGDAGSSSKITIAPMVEGKKLILKPPRYGYIANRDILTKTTSEIELKNK